MRTNLEIDMAKIEKIRELDVSLSSKNQIVDLALDHLIAILSREKLIQMRGKVKWE